MHITSRDNPKVKWAAKLVRDRAFRRAEGAFLCEGRVMLEEALRSGAEILQLFCLEELADGLPAGLEAPVDTVSASVLDKISDTVSPPGLAFVCRMPEQRPPRGEKVFALENPADPGNLGTILRTAEGLGMDQVILSGAAVDRYSPKVIRASMGSIFRMPVCELPLPELKDWLSRQGIRLLGAALSDRARPLHELSLEKSCVMVGNEARGLSREALALCDGEVIIPIKTIESLNASAAATILMWEMSKYR